ncbi:hypothetical protein [Rhodococcus sp. NPDC049939]|uniref:hypothetical protein n=1 Tax=Rhodococcus sp. NPDC049939 TaxID=3155511 RepID=UPI0033D8F88F
MTMPDIARCAPSHIVVRRAAACQCPSSSPHLDDQMPRRVDYLTGITATMQRLHSYLPAVLAEEPVVATDLSD